MVLNCSFPLMNKKKSQRPFSSNILFPTVTIQMPLGGPKTGHKHNSPLAVAEQLAEAILPPALAVTYRPLA